MPRFGNEDKFKDPYADENDNIDKLVGQLIQPADEGNNQKLTNDDSFSNIAPADPSKDIDQAL